MAITTKTPVRAVFDGTNAAVGLAEFQTDEVVPISHGGTSGNSISSAKLALSLTDSNIRSLFSISGGGSFDNSTGIITVTGGVASVGGATGTVSNAQLLSSVTSAGLLANTSLTGIPLAPTASTGTNTTQIATTAFVTSAVSNLIDSAPGALDTFIELAAAINDDNNFATTIVTQLGNKANIASLTTANVAELTNLYFSNARAILAEIPAVTQLAVTANGSSAFLIDSYSGNNPTIYVTAGETISFDLNVPGHPFMIRISSGGSNYSTGLTHIATNGTETTDSSAQSKVTGKLFWKVPSSLAGSTYVYQCSVHAGMVGNIVIQKPVSTITTADVAEVTNLYFSNARARSALSAGDGTIVYDPTTGQIRATANITATIENTVNNLSTSDVTEGSRLYFTNARVFAAVTGNLALKANVVDLTTANVIELNSLYFTDARARQAISTSGCTLSYSNTTGILSFSQGNTDTINEGSTNLYYTNARVFSAVTGNLALKANLTDKLNVFATTTSAQFAEVISDKTGTGGGATGKVVFSSSPTFTGTITAEEISASGNVTSPFFYSQSDINLKKDLVHVTNALDIVNQLDGYWFKWKSNDADSLGMIAQHVESVLPMLIGTSPDGSKTIQYNGIIAILLEAIKAQQVQIDEIKAKLNG